MKNFLLKKSCVFAIIASLFLSCSSPKLFMLLSDQYGLERMQVVGFGSGTGRKNFSFANYTVNNVDRGWNISSSKQDRKSNSWKEELLLRAFNIEKKNMITTQKDQFDFMINDAQSSFQVFALESKIAKETRITTGSQWLSESNKTESSQYVFAAVIKSLSPDTTTTWIFSMRTAGNNSVDRFPLDQNAVEEGILTDGIDSIIIKSIASRNLINENGEYKNLPLKIPSGYEWSAKNKVIGVVDFLGKVIWLDKNLNQQTKFAIAAGSSAILLRRIQK